MQIHVCRHAQAAAASVSGRDADRPLTRTGRLQARYLARHIAGELAAAFARGSADWAAPAAGRGRLLSSPATRAAETAAAIADELGLGVELCPALGPGARTSAAYEAIASAPPAPWLVVVGHNPTISALVALLLLGPGAADARIALRTGELASVGFASEPTPGAGTLLGAARYAATAADEPQPESQPDSPHEGAPASPAASWGPAGRPAGPIGPYSKASPHDGQRSSSAPSW